jgi:hypothetical protein
MSMGKGYKGAYKSEEIKSNNYYKFSHYPGKLQGNSGAGIASY